MRYYHFEAVVLEGNGQTFDSGLVCRARDEEEARKKAARHFGGGSSARERARKVLSVGLRGDYATVEDVPLDD